MSKCVSCRKEQPCHGQKAKCLYYDALWRIRVMKEADEKRPVPRVRVYSVLRRAVEDGTDYGYRRAHKHTDKPDEEAVKDEIVTAILGEISDWFEFDE